MGHRWPLVGRAEELDFISAALAEDAGSRGVVVSGEPGVGKTRVAREALEAARVGGAVTLWVVATESARGLPLGAFAGLVGFSDSDPARVLPQAAKALVAGSGGSELIVGVDDAHLLDEVSALFVNYLAVRTEVGLVVTVRSGERAPDAVVALWKEEVFDRIDLQPLSEEETGRLLQAVFDGPVESATAARIWELTRGNALFLRHLVDGEASAGRLDLTHGVWGWSGDLELTSGLVELVEARMGELSEPVSEVVDMLALAEPLTVEMLSRLSSPEAVEEAESLGLVEIVDTQGEPRGRLAHPLYGEVHRARMGTLYARRLRGRIAEAMTAHGGSGEDELVRRAVLVVRSDVKPDPDLLTVAAAISTRLADLALAAELAGAAVSNGGGAESRLILARALSWLTRGEEAELELRAVYELPLSDSQRAVVALFRVANLFWILGRAKEAETVLYEADKAIVDGEARRVLDAVRSPLRLSRGQVGQAIQFGTSALGSSQLPGPAVLLATIGVVGGLGVAGRGDELATAAGVGYDRKADAVLRFGLSEIHMIGLRLAGYLDEMQRIAGDRREESLHTLGPVVPFGIALIGHAALATGHLASAVRWLHEARVGLADAAGEDYHCLVSLTQALALTGKVEAARLSLEELESQRHPAWALVDPDAALAHAWVAASEGAVSSAISTAHDAASVAANRGQLAYEVLSLHTAVRLGDTSPAQRLADLAERVDGPRATAAAIHALGLAADDSDALSSAAADLEHMGDRIAAADAMAQASTAYARQGRKAAAHHAADTAHRLAEACRARTPAIMAAARPLPLTQREREIAALAARGLTNREIADKLVVSVRTVEGHLYRASIKLGTHSRRDLPGLFAGG